MLIEWCAEEEWRPGYSQGLCFIPGAKVGPVPVIDAIFGKLLHALLDRVGCGVWTEHIKNMNIIITVLQQCCVLTMSKRQLHTLNTVFQAQRMGNARADCLWTLTSTRNSQGMPVDASVRQYFQLAPVGTRENILLRICRRQFWNVRASKYMSKRRRCGSGMDPDF